MINCRVKKKAIFNGRKKFLHFDFFFTGVNETRKKIKALLLLLLILTCHCKLYDFNSFEESIISISEIKIQIAKKAKSKKKIVMRLHFIMYDDDDDDDGKLANKKSKIN